MEIYGNDPSERKMEIYGNDPSQFNHETRAIL